MIVVLVVLVGVLVAVVYGKQAAGRNNPTGAQSYREDRIIAAASKRRYF
jgi:hypothetical protein